MKENQLPAIPSNPFGEEQQHQSLVNLSDQQTQSVQAACVLAKRYPRNQMQAYTRIIESCKRPGLAVVARYTYPRGGQQISGPSIRLAEECARQWGNLDFGIVELDSRDGKSTMMSYCWDLETNVRSQKVFDVSHARTKNNRQTGQKETTILEDPRDVYEMNANQAARRLRACILSVIPGDVIEDAVAQCERTLINEGGQEPIRERAKKLVSAFHPFGVTAQMIENRLGHNMEAISEQEMVDLRGIYTSLRDGMSKPIDWFNAEAPKATPPQQEARQEAEQENPADEIPMDQPKPKRKRRTKAEMEEARKAEQAKEQQAASEVVNPSNVEPMPTSSTDQAESTEAPVSVEISSSKHNTEDVQAFGNALQVAGVSWDQAAAWLSAQTGVEVKTINDVDPKFMSLVAGNIPVTIADIQQNFGKPKNTSGNPLMD